MQPKVSMKEEVGGFVFFVPYPSSATEGAAVHTAISYITKKLLKYIA